MRRIPAGASRSPSGITAVENAEAAFPVGDREGGLECGRACRAVRIVGVAAAELVEG